MRRIFLLAVPVLIACIAGYRVAPGDVASASEPQRGNKTPQAANKNDPRIGVADLLEALDMKMWKARVNDDAEQRITKVTLSLKKQGSESNALLTHDIPEAGPGTLLVYLQDLPTQRDKLGIIYHGDTGRSGSTSNVVDDPFTEVVGMKGSPGAAIGRRGVTVLRSSADSDVSKPQTVAYFLKGE